MPPKTKINEDQGTMFVQGYVPKIETPVDVALLTAPNNQATEYPAGPSVLIADHSRNVIDALSNLGLASQRSGGIIYTSGSGSKDFEQRYGANSDRVIEGMANKREELLQTSKQKLARAMGTSGMVASGLMTEEQANAEVDESFSKFKSMYADATNRAARNAEKKKLGKVLKVITEPKKKSKVDESK